MRQFEWRWLYGSVWVSALQGPVGVGHRWIHGASTLSCVKWHQVESQVTTPSTSFHVRFPQPKFPVTKEPSGLFRSDGKRPDGIWRWYPGKEVCLSHGMLQSLLRWQTPTFRPLYPQLRWRRPENKPSIRRIVRVVRVPADCFGNFGLNQRIGCAVLKRSGPQNHFCLYRW